MFYQEGNKLFRRYDGELLCIEACGDNALRVRATMLGRFKKDKISALLPDIKQTYPVIEIKDDRASICNGKIRCEVLATGKITFYEANSGKVLLKEYDKNRFRRQKVKGEKDSALGIGPRTFCAHRGTDCFKLEVRFEANECERFYGMGQYSQPYLDLKGCTLELAQRNSQVSIPFAVSNCGYGFLWNNPAHGYATYGKNVTLFTADSTAEMDYWITCGDNPAQIVSTYADVTGKVPMMPDYALGFWQCKLRYRTQDEVLEVARKYKELGLPLSVIVIDFFHWTAQGDFKFDPKYWPDPEKMVRELKELGVELMVSVWPTVEEGSENFLHMEEMGYLIRTEAGPRLGIKNKDTYMDATNPEARKFVWQKLKENYFDKGIHLFWLDECEPEIIKYEYENYRYFSGSVLETGNIYPLDFAKMVYEGRKAAGDENILSLIRCAWAGSQRYGSLVWTGDVSSDFETLRNQIAAGISMGLSGIPWWTTDIGGFHGGNIYSDEFKECLVRWFEFGAFCPVFRLHGFRLPILSFEGKEAFNGTDAKGWYFSSGSPNEIWSYGEEVFEICKRYLFLREKLRPYLKELMKEAHIKGSPVMRAVFYEYPNDSKAWSIEDEYMLGSSILVAPITEQGARSRTVYLPEGEWTELFSGKTYQGGKEIKAQADLSQIPVFIKDTNLFLKLTEA